MAQTGQTGLSQNSQAQAEQARIKAQREAAERAARERAPVARLDDAKAPVLGEFPEEEACFAIKEIAVAGAQHSRLQWVPGFLEQYRGRCAGSQGLDYILRSLQAAFLDRGLITTRAGLPEQNLASGTLIVQVVPGVASGVTTNGEAKAFTWDVASPVDGGDIVDLRALEQGLEQMRRIQGREVNVDLEPGEAPGETVLAVTSEQPRYLSASLGVNNYAGDTVGNWQGNAQIATLGLLGASEILSLSYNTRIAEPDVPGDSSGFFGSLTFPLGWWTFGVSGSANDYSQQVLGEVRDFETSGRLRTVSGFAERVIGRTQTSRTAVRGSLSRRWARNFIDDVEIGIQRQDVTDLTAALLDRRYFGDIRVDSQFAMRFGLDIFGAQDENDSRPEELPTARYRIASADISVTIPFNTGANEGFFDSWNTTIRAQYSDQNLYGADAIAIGGPFTVRGFDVDRALIGRSGFFMRQELRGRLPGPLGDIFSPFAFLDMGKVNGNDGIAGAGLGLRAAWKGLTLDGFAALPIKRAAFQQNDLRFGVALGWSI
ncbi:ShlB/FhaC/HecB family hemolysin secretion/activation protein [Alterisphingorhabdus coralli]|uniref:ShlB/FhaC/HecB family hemolysin secretion/activation protein n=1 Tax=Alterisphingorhabdus coralli TaxID=3071408 RepID=A0AA97F5X4_9SPHN|nr:ShlB/FhaC/HecB family hemolysin secretion/activation protein [Parasphingorhabdus sp. SCSIO 66989]WOE74046.1 ShlB/FhaC/HecB family hemolysin secretion/activation protein [Parasphingorhabdus sp. SCSIO 66989]